MAKLGQADVSTSPITKHVEWKGAKTDGFFQYYDKEAKENKKFEIKEFVILTIGYTIKGYNPIKEKGIWSNEVENLAREEFFVKCDGQVIHEGLYRDIKEKVKQSGGRLHIAVTVLQDGEVFEFFLKGQAYYSFSEMLKASDRNKVCFKFTGAKDEKTKAMEYKLPIFDVGKDISKSEMEAGLKTLSVIEEYRKMANPPKQNDSMVDEDDDIDDLPF